MTADAAAFQRSLDRLAPQSSNGAAASLRICLAYGEKNVYSETFIRSHIERLPGTVLPVFGKGFPVASADGRVFLSYDAFPRAFRDLVTALFSLSPTHYETRALTRYLREERIDIVLSEYGPTGLAVMEACRKAEVPHVVHFHGWDAYASRTLDKYGPAYRRLFAEAQAIIAVSHAMEQQLVDLGAPKEKIFYNPCGVDASTFRGADPASAPPHFLAVGRFVDKKAPHLTLLAFKKTVEACPEARLTMIGNGELLDPCRQLAKALHIDACVDFPGVRSHADTAAAMVRARAFVQHSLTTTDGNSEGTPVGLMEAAATGIPSVSTNHAGIPDVVIDGETGFLVDEGDVDGMAERMIVLARDPALAMSLGRKARAHVIANFSLERSIQNLAAIVARAAAATEPR